MYAGRGYEKAVPRMYIAHMLADEAAEIYCVCILKEAVMELGRQTTAEPIVFDFDSLDLNDNLRQHTGYPLFLAGRAKFAEDLQNAVALGHGIDEEGRLDMDMYQAAQAAESYLEGRQGQPVVLAENIFGPEGNFVRVDALVGVLGTDDKLVGTHRRHNSTYGGIALQGSGYEMSAYRVFGPLRLERSIPMNAPESSEDGLLSFDNPTVTLGKPGGEDREDGYRHTQELLAGEDIMEWVKRQFPEPLEGYEIVKGLLMALRTPEAQAYVLQEPYVTLLKAETGTLERIQDKLSAYHTKVAQLEQARLGALAQASLDLSAIEEELVIPAARLPYTHDSNRNHILAEVEGLRDLAARQAAVERAQNYLGKLVVK